MTGRELGQYQVAEKLGEGGMGIVYKARDTRLNRYVALKVLLSDSVADPDRKKRFIQEARAASALNHPNIITVHDIAHEDGVDFIVMEYVSGKTLEDAIRGRGMPVVEALRCGAQVADALAAAHRAGIVHRDLKPPNIMVSDSGLVKVLDFGLAKLSERPPASGHDGTHTDLTGEPLTGKGTIVGTVNYMSPEQAQGKPLDARSDIFSFGAVLYEMVTGRKAFRGDTPMSTISAILRDDPTAASDINAGLPTELDRIIARCLRKNPERRFQDMDDLRVALEELKEESESGKLAVTHVPRPRRSRLPVVIALLGCLLAVAAVATWVSGGHGGGPPADPVLVRLTSDSGLTTEPALSPDGKLVAYASDRAGEGNLDIWIQQIGGGEARRLTTDPADDREPSFSPDGSRIVFSSEREDGGLYLVSPVAGIERKIAGRGYRPRFSPDGKQIAFWVGDRAGGGFARAASAPHEVRVVSADGGPSRRVQGNLSSAWMPVWSPDGARLVVQGLGPKPDAPQEQIVDWWVVPLNSGAAVSTGVIEALQARNLLRTHGGAPEQLPAPELWSQNQLLFSAGLGDSANIWRITVSSRNFKASGAIERLTSGVATELNPFLWQGPDRTRIVFASQTSNVNIWGIPFDPDRGRTSGEARPLTDSVADDVRPSLSADGQVLVYNSNRSGNWDVWLKDLASGREIALASSAADEEAPRISPDGRDVVYCIRNVLAMTSYLIPARGGLARKLLEDSNPYPWAHGSRRYLDSNAGGMSIVDIESGGRKQVATLATTSCSLSWDDRWMTCYRPAEQPGRSRIFAAPVRDAGPTAESEWVSITAGDASDSLPEFSPDGRVIYFLSLRDGFGCLWGQRLDPATKKPLGDPFAIQHFHSARRSPGSVRSGLRGISIARNMVVSTISANLRTAANDSEIAPREPARSRASEG